MEFEFNGRLLRYKDGKFYILLIKNWKEFRKDDWMELSVNTNNELEYKTIRINNKSFYVHRILAYLFLGLDINNNSLFVEHIDNDRTNNNIDNLKIITRGQNSLKREIKCYTFDKKVGKFKATISFNNKQIHLGLFKAEEKARQAYLDAKAKYHP